GEQAATNLRELTLFAQAIAQKVQSAPNARPADLLNEVDLALRAKPQRTDLPPLSPSTIRQDPRAERAFARGLSAYRTADLQLAEREFAAAVGFNNLDARYWYFLGLTKSTQGQTTQADADFRQGLERERRNLPNSGAIDASLERLPPEARQILNQARGR